MSTQLKRDSLTPDQSVSITIALPADDMKLLRALSKRTGTTKENLIKKFVADGAEDMGDVFIAKDVMEGIRTGKGKLRTWEEAGLDF